MKEVIHSPDSFHFLWTVLENGVGSLLICQPPLKKAAVAFPRDPHGPSEACVEKSENPELVIRAIDVIKRDVERAAS